MDTTIRAFIAIPLEPAGTEAIRRIQARLRARLPDIIRWTNPEQVHVTLKFLGNIDMKQAPEIAQAIQRAIAQSEPFPLHIEDVGCFPNARKPNVLWAGLGGNREALLKLQGNIETETSIFCEHQEERAFQPHLTLGRVRNGKFREARMMAERLQEIKQEPVAEWTVRQVHLMQSELGPDGARHFCLAKLAVKEQKSQ